MCSGIFCSEPEPQIEAVKLLITTIPGYGHLCPLIPMAQLLAANGHDVAIATSNGFHAAVRRAGIRLLPSGPEWQESEFCCDAPRAKPVEGFRTDLFGFLESTVTPRMMRDVASHVDTWRPDIVLSNDYEPCGRAVAEARSIPFVLASSGPRLPRVFRDQMQGPLHRQARTLAGLAGESFLDYSFRWLHLCFSPANYFFSSGVVNDYQKSVVEHGIRPSIDDALFLGAKTAHDSQHRRRHRPTVLCTFGSVFNKNPALIQSIARGLRSKVERLVVLLGPGMAPFPMADRYDHVEFVSHAPLSELLPQVDYCVTHGGTSTLMTLLAHGKPSILLPQGADQMLNAVVCDQKKLAVMKLNATTDVAASVPGRLALTPDLVADCFDELTGNPIYSENLGYFQTELRKLPELSTAVRLLERLAETRAPVIA